MFPRDQDARQELMYNTQLRIIELLEQLINVNKTPEQTKIMVDKPVNKTTTNRNQRRNAQ